MMSDSQIERAAEEMLEAHEVRRIPIDLLAIAQSEGIRVIPGEYDNNFEGRIEFRDREAGGRFYLFHAEEGAARSRGRVRFSIAHELGHYSLPEHREYLLSGIWHGSQMGFVSDKPMEREADKFAAALLMPRHAFVEQATRPGGASMKDLKRLADQIFDTSLTSTAIRYAQLSLEPCCVVMSTGGSILYSICSEDLRLLGTGWLDREKPLPRKSVTARMLHDRAAGTAVKTEGSVESDVWFGSGRSRTFWEEALELGSTGLVLTLLTLDEDEE